MNFLRTIMQKTKDLLVAITERIAGVMALLLSFSLFIAARNFLIQFAGLAAGLWVRSEVAEDTPAFTPYLDAAMAVTVAYNAPSFVPAMLSEKNYAVASTALALTANYFNPDIPLPAYNLGAKMGNKAANAVLNAPSRALTYSYTQMTNVAHSTLERAATGYNQITNFFAAHVPQRFLP